ncbi:MAG TPA: ribosomal L7Ae/L30e/S12e/Gadd45 family protein [bacterium]|jgi:ribosomal protein L7Ae-like RNA K-turn-binding protein|nr:ribosomal L7Ae/L30e/S12e/Gadd45 family protein [bacterium]
MTTDEKLLSLIGLANRARRLAIGRQAVSAGLQHKEADLVLLAGDAPSRLGDQLAAVDKVRLAFLPRSITKDVLGRILGRKPVAIIAVCDRHFADGILSLLPAVGQRRSASHQQR